MSGSSNCQRLVHILMYMVKFFDWSQRGWNGNVLIFFCEVIRLAKFWILQTFRRQCGQFLQKQSPPAALKLAKYCRHCQFCFQNVCKTQNFANLMTPHKNLRHFCFNHIGFIQNIQPINMSTSLPHSEKHDKLICTLWEKIYHKH